MKATGSQIIVHALKEENVRIGFGIPGTHNIELYDALADEPDFKSILVTDEQSASFMADGYARASGELAMVSVVPGAGLSHALSGIAEAYMDTIPMLVLACAIRSDTGHAYQLHDIDQVAMARPVCKGVFEPKNNAELYLSIRHACRLAKKSPAGPVMVTVPANLYLFRQEVSDEDLVLVEDLLPSQLESSQVEKIIHLLNQSKNIGLYVGLGAQGAIEPIRQLANDLDALVFTTISGKGIFPEKNPRWVWNTMGAALPKPFHDLSNQVDCLLAIGCRFGEVATGSYGFKPPENLIHIDIDETVFNKNYPAKITLKADAREAVCTLLASQGLKVRETNQEKLQSLRHVHEAIQIIQAEENKSGVHPNKLFSAFQSQFGDQTVFVTDSGNGLFMAMEHLRLNHPRSFLGPVDYSCMGYSVPAAIGAKLSSPDRSVVALVGDGAFLMTGLEMITAVNESLGVVFCILRDGELAQIAQFQERSLNRKTGTNLYPINFSDLAKSMGITYLSIENNAEIQKGVSEAFKVVQDNKPVLLEAKIDYSQSTFFSQGVVKTNFLRLPWKDRFRFVGRVLKRKIL